MQVFFQSLKIKKAHATLKELRRAFYYFEPCHSKFFDARKASYEERRMVPKRGLEPPHLAAQPPQGCVSTNFTTWALQGVL